MTTTSLSLPDSLPYPITITAVPSPPNTQVSRGTPLLHYSFDFTHKRRVPADPTEVVPPPKTERRFGTWESPVDGVIQSVAVRPGTRLNRQDAKAKPALTILEECSHPVQISGMCAVCGKDTTITDYIGISDESRASIRMTHDAAGPTVSQSEAQRIEQETAHRLLDSRKLILIVDLDQTIVHATVDPTVGEWMAQGEAYKKRKLAREAKVHARAEKKAAAAAAADDDDEGADSSSDGASDDDDDDEADKEDEVNPNWAMLEDVHTFKLGPDPVNGHPQNGHVAEQPGCDYYIKSRPGLKHLLEKLMEKYEMHVYTMGTRAYALQVCKAIDPEGTIFNERILTRDESGSMTQKSIERLFPYNNSMVVIIDDRADVWGYSPNLVKVVPYDFFVGIGDINATYLPKSPDPLGPAAPTKAVSSLSLSSPTDAPTDSATPTLASSPHTASPPPMSTELDVTKAEVESTLVAEAQSKALVTQLEERPLAKMQEALDASEEIETKVTNGSEKEKDVTIAEHPHHKSKPILTNDDWELDRVWNILDEVHRRFFTAHDLKAQSGHLSNGKGKQKGSLNRSALVPDVKVIIPGIKAETLAGVHILFSSLIPLGMTPERSDAWRYAHEFGAKCYTRLSDEVTHVVSAKEGTEKVIKGFQRGNIKVVWAKWFQDCIALWKHLDETGDYLLPPPSKKTMDEMEAAQTPSGASAENGKSAGNDEVVMDTGTPRGTDTPQDTGTPPAVDLDLDWAAAGDDVDAFLNESSDSEEDEDPATGDKDDREDLGEEIDEEKMNALFAEVEEDEEDFAYGQNSIASTSREGARKRRRSQSVGSVVSASDAEEVTPSAKRAKVTPPEPSVKISEDDSDDSDEEGDEDEEMAVASEPPSSAPSSDAEDDDDGIDVENGHDGADDDGDSGSEEESEDEEFLSGLAEPEGWG